MNVQKALALYLLQLEADGRSHHTIDQYRRHVRLFADWIATEGLSADVAEVGHEFIARFLVSPLARTRPDGRAKRPTSMNALRTSLRGFYGYLNRAGVIPVDPTRLVRRAICSVGPPRALSVKEEKKLLAVLDAGQGKAAERDRMLFRLMLATGIRVGSAVGLALEDVDLERRELRLRNMKGGREDVVFLPSAIVPLLREFVAGLAPGPLFPGQAGAPLTPRHVHRRLRTCAEKAGIARSISPHMLRHTTATRLYERCGGDLLLVQRALCHRSIASTMVYARASDRRLRVAIEGEVGDVGVRSA